jgi:hypothetical protein
MRYKLLFLGLGIMCHCLTACKQYAVARLGIKEPQVETRESLKQYLLTHNFPLQDQFILKDTSGFYFMIKEASSEGPVGTLIFDKNYHLLTRDTSRCQWIYGEGITDLSKAKSFPLSDSFNGEELLKLMTPLDGTTDELSLSPGDFDFLVVNRWAKYLGRINDKIFNSYSIAKSRTDLKIVILNLNLDMQESWNLSDDQKLKMKWE